MNKVSLNETLRSGAVLFNVSCNKQVFSSKTSKKFDAVSVLSFSRKTHFNYEK